MIKQEIRNLSSRFLDGGLMRHGTFVLTWFKAPFMPWVLLLIVPAVPE